MSRYLTYIDDKFVHGFQNKRQNEKHVADTIRLPNKQLSLLQNLANAKENGVKYVVLGIPEDIGPRANCGNGGAHKGWDNFLPVFLNQQSNHFFDWSQCLLLGEVKTDDLQHHSFQATLTDHKLTSLRDLCEQLDQRVIDVVSPIFAEQLELIVIGGGHNNAYPLIHALFHAQNKKVGCCNLDPHSDFRAVEGRHSGNPFRYAYDQKQLGHYCIIGLHEQKNNQNSLSALDEAGFPYYSFQNLKMRHQQTFEQQLSEAQQYLTSADGPLGIELDLDSIKHTGASAYSVTGFSIEEAVRYVYQMSSLSNVNYVHLCEGAPSQKENAEFTSHKIGQTLTQLVYAYLSSRKDNN